MKHMSWLTSHLGSRHSHLKTARYTFHLITMVAMTGLWWWWKWWTLMNYDNKNNGGTTKLPTNLPDTSSKGAILNSLSATSNAHCKFSGAVLLVRFSYGIRSGLMTKNNGALDFSERTTDICHLILRNYKPVFMNNCTESQTIWPTCCEICNGDIPVTVREEMCLRVMTKSRRGARSHKTSIYFFKNWKVTEYQWFETHYSSKFTQNWSHKSFDLQQK